MKKRRMVSLMLIVAFSFGMFLGRVEAAETKYGYGYKDGKLYSVEIRENGTQITEVDKITASVLPGFSDDRYKISRKVGNSYKHFFVDKAGKQIGKEYDEVYAFADGLAKVGKENNDHRMDYGFIDWNGKEVIPPQYLWAEDFSDGLSIVTSGDDRKTECGVIDKKGKEVIPFKYSFISDFNEYGIAIFSIQEGDKYFNGLIDKKGKVILPAEYYYIEIIQDTKLFKLAKGDWQNASYGIADFKGNILADANYPKFEMLADLKLLRLEKEERESCGIIDYNGEIIVPFDATFISELQENRFFVKKGKNEQSRFGLVDTKGNILYPYELSTFDNYEHGLARVCKGENYDHWGLLDKDGKEVVPCEMDYIYPFSEGLATFKDKKGNYGFLDKRGKVVISLGKKYQMVDYFSDGLCQVKKNGKFGYINKKGKLVIPCKFKEADLFINGLARIYNEDTLGNRRIGLINKKGKQVTPVHFADVEYKDDGAIKVGIRNGNVVKYGFLDKKGKEILPLKYGDVLHNYGKISMVSITKYNGDVKYGLATQDGKLDKNIKYDDIWTPYKGMFKTEKINKFGNRKNGMLNKQGKEVLKCVYDEIENYTDYGTDLAIISNKGKKGLIDEKGKIIVPIKYHGIYHNEYGATVVLGKNFENAKYGFVNPEGKFILKPIYDNIGGFENGIAFIEKKGRVGYVNTKGKVVIPIKFDYITYFSEKGYALAGFKGKNGMIDRKGNTLIPFEYEFVSRDEEGGDYYMVGKNDKVGYINEKGKILVPIEFDYIFMK